MTAELLRRQEGAILILSNNNTAARNALSLAYYEAVMQNLQQAADDPSVAVIILTGEGGHFCAGGDLRQLGSALSEQQRQERLKDLNRFIRAVRDCPKPVIAAVDGAVAGAGMSLALACDMLVAARTAVFSVAYVKVGLTPDGGMTSLLSEFVSRQVMTELCLTGERISAERMHQWGCINRLTETGEALATAQALAQQLSAGPQQAMASIKMLCHMAQHQSMDQQLELEAQHMVQAQLGDEAQEGIRAFLEKRAPDFAALRR